MNRLTIRVTLLLKLYVKDLSHQKHFLKAQAPVALYLHFVWFGNDRPVASPVLFGHGNQRSYKKQL